MACWERLRFLLWPNLRAERGRPKIYGCICGQWTGVGRIVSIILSLLFDMLSYNRNWIVIDCPHCQYSFEVMLLNVQVEDACYCHNCKSAISLGDENAGAHYAMKQMAISTGIAFNMVTLVNLMETSTGKEDIKPNFWFIALCLLTVLNLLMCTTKKWKPGWRNK